MRFQLTDGQVVLVDRPFTFNGINYPATWLRHMSPADRLAFGATELPEPVAPVTPAPAMVPQVVTPRQARRALAAAGLLAQVEAAVAAADEVTKIDWEYAIEIRRDNALIAAMAASLNLTEQQIDELFTAAAQIQ